MNPVYRTENLTRCNIEFENSAECTAEAVLSMPDYCPEIKRILKSAVQVNSISVHSDSGFINVNAETVLRIIYVSEEGQLSSYEQPHFVEKKVEGPGDNDCVIFADLTTDYINTRALSPRKVDIKAVLNLKIKAVKLRKEELLCSAEGGGIQLKTKNFCCSDVTAMSDKFFSLSETAEIAKDKKPVSKIISNNAYIAVNEIKTINNKALLKGNCIVTVHYLTEDNCQPECCEFSLPVSQIIETEGLSEKARINLKNSLVSFEAVPRVDSSGEMRLIDLNLRFRAVLTAFEDKNISLIKDCYSTEYPLISECRKTELSEFADLIENDFTNKVVLESIGVTVESVLASWCSDLKYSFRQNGDKCELRGSYLACVIYKDAENQTDIIQKPIDFDYSFNLKKNCSRIRAVGSASICASSCTISGESRLEMKTEISVNAVVFSVNTVDYISKAEIDESASLKNTSCSLTVYFCEKGENVWNIARKYNTTVDAIKCENGIDEDVINNKQMILVPLNN